MVGQLGMVALGGAGGVAIPLGAEYVLQGARVNIGGVSTKWSGLIGIGEGVVGGLVATGKVVKGATPDQKLAAAAMAASGAAVGVSIIVLEEMRKRAQYTFQQEQAKQMRERLESTDGRVGLKATRMERQEHPIQPGVEEV